MSFQSTTVPVWGFDTETDRIGPNNVAPDVICFSLAGRDPANNNEITAVVYGDGDPEFWPWIEQLLKKAAEGKRALVGQTIHYDMSCIAKMRPDLLPSIFAAYAAGMIFDTEIREKLLNVSTHGKLRHITAPDGSGSYVRYRLEDLVLAYCGIDRSDEKNDEDSWRMNYGSLRGQKAADYPPGAYQYAAQDSIDTLLVFEAQDARVVSPEGGPTSVKTQEFQVGCAFALRLATVVGVQVDPERLAIVKAEVESELTYDKLNLLIESGILRPGVPPKPYANGATHPDGTLKMTKGKRPSKNTKLLSAHVQSLCEQLGMKVKKTKKGAVKTSSEVIEALAPHCPVMAQYQHREALQKLVTTYIPAMHNPDGTVAHTVHPDFDVLKETGRTSSYSSKLYASANIQQVDPRIRECYTPRPGWLMYSVDISGAELLGLGWKVRSLFGHSVLLDLLNAGGDAHAFLGAQIAYFTDAGFRSACDSSGARSNEDRYKLFISLKGGDENAVAFYNHYRKFAKPTGLGYPGGLGPKTFVEYASKTYGVKVDHETAKQLQGVWFDAYPEMRNYFEWIKRNCPDARNAIIGHADNGRPIQGYSYYSPMGMYRAGATFTAACNGAALQTPTGEACKLAFWEVTRASYDASLGSCLFGTRPLAFIHDEILGEVPDDEYAHERVMEVSRIMEAAVATIFPGTVPRTEPALMRRWNKFAGPVFDENGRLTVWEPKD